jgi:hypothetical protein
MERNSTFKYQMLVLLAAACAAIVEIPLVSGGEERQAPPQVEVVNADSVSTGVRFEGYLFLDTEGQPLPFQTDAEIEAFLAEAEIIETSSVPTGVTLPRKLTLRGDDFGACALFKDVDIFRHKVTEIINGRNRFSLDWHDSYRYDIAAYELDRLLGLDRVPPVVPRNINHNSGAISIWLAKTVNEFDRSRKLKVEPPDQGRWNQQRLLMQVFDNLVANRDSNLGNVLIDPNWRLWFIDCSRCFGITKSIYYPLKKITRCERGIWLGLKNLDETEVRKRLAPYLSLAEMDALLVRHEKMVKYFQELIDERGEAAVLYDVDPPSEKAPWAVD